MVAIFGQVDAADIQGRVCATGSPRSTRRRFRAGGSRHQPCRAATVVRRLASRGRPTRVLHADLVGRAGRAVARRRPIGVGGTGVTAFTTTGRHGEPHSQNQRRAKRRAKRCRHRCTAERANGVGAFHVTLAPPANHESHRARLLQPKDTACATRSPSASLLGGRGRGQSAGLTGPRADEFSCVRPLGCAASTRYLRWCGAFCRVGARSRR